MYIGRKRFQGLLKTFCKHIKPSMCSGQDLKVAMIHSYLPHSRVHCITLSGNRTTALKAFEIYEAAVKMIQEWQEQFSITKLIFPSTFLLQFIREEQMCKLSSSCTLQVQRSLYFYCVLLVFFYLNKGLKMNLMNDTLPTFYSLHSSVQVNMGFIYIGTNPSFCCKSHAAHLMNLPALESIQHGHRAIIQARSVPTCCSCAFSCKHNFMSGETLAELQFL